MRIETRSLTIDGLGTVPLSYTSTGSGRAILLLHGGGGPATVVPWGERIAAELPAEVFVPIHPGFDYTRRPGAVDSIRAVARTEVALLNELKLEDVTVIGNSIGGWVAMEVALLASPRVARVILIDSVGIEVDGHPIPDFFTMTPAELAQHSYYDPATYGLDPTKIPDAVRQRMIANRTPLALYAGSAMSDPGLAVRLDQITVPTLVVWGEADRIGDVGYGRQLAAMIPGARFELIERAGHLPQIEQPAALADLVRTMLTA